MAIFEPSVCVPPTLVPDATTDQLGQFETRLISHPLLESCYTDLRSVTRRPGVVPLIEVVGPSGAGKSTLVRRLNREILKESERAMQMNPGLIPIILVEAPSPDNGNFQWGDFYHRFLEAEYEPMIGRKSPGIAEGEFRERRKKTGTFAELRRAVEQCIRYRGTKIVIIDEAQHLTKVVNARRLQDQMDTIKSLASLSGVQFVMVGTYELLTLLNQNGQLARRARCIHFRRYNLRQPGDQQVFLNILAMFESRLPVQASGVLVNNLDYIYEHCLGCVGVFKDWLNLACGHSVEAGRGTLELQDLEVTALSNDSLLQLLQEITEGEGRIESSMSKGEELRKKLGLQKPQSPQSEGGRAPSQRRAVGERNPHRDLVGVGV
jgi:energy-coupling factor transporter ATP-binding protein EcfA2